MAMSKRMEFLNKLKNAVFENKTTSSSDSASTENNAGLSSNKASSSVNLSADLYLSSDDNERDPNFDPGDSTGSDYSIISEKNTYKEKNRRKKKSASEERRDEPAIISSDNCNGVEDAVSSNTHDAVACSSTQSHDYHVTPVVLSSQPSDLESKEPKRQRKANPNNWKRNLNKIRRLKGEEYVTTKGKLICAKPMLPPLCRGLKNHQSCNEVNEDSRKLIYSEYHALNTVQAQREFLIRHVQKENAKRTLQNSRKKFTKKYFLTFNGTLHPVCRKFFLRTLGISEGLVKGAFKKFTNTGIVQPDFRGGKRINVKNPDSESFLREHILSFPAVESHYCRSSGNFKYLDSNLNIQKMYSMYKEKCNEQGKVELCYESYRRIFKSYKLKFHQPKKDLCKTCVVFKDCSDAEKELLQDKYNKHLARKEAARKRRDEDKEAAQRDNKILSFNFDLQAVLSTPKGAAGPFFYVRKLAIYNLTIYNLGNANVDCFTWDETEGKRGSSEIATCIYQYILSHPDITHVRMMSDNCPGQQKNYNFSFMCLYLIKNHPSLQLIEHVFFESGHSQMECDSAHSKIERKSKNVPVYTHEGWAQIMRLARTKPTPFKVTTLIHSDFLNFNPPSFVKTKVKNITDNDNYADAVWFKYKKSNPNSIFYRSSYEEGEFQVMTPRKSKKIGLPFKLYKERLRISTQKKKDLLQLCKQRLIPNNYHEYYEQLPSSSQVRDKLAEPDVSELDYNE